MRVWTCCWLLGLSGCAQAGGPATIEPERLSAPTELGDAGLGPSDDLMWRGAPLHPFCIAQMDYEVSLDVTECAASPQEVILERGGLASYPPPMDGEDGGVNHYRVLGRYGDGIAIEYMNNGGGTGYFTGILVLALHGTRLTRLEHPEGSGGDRCNGGLFAAELIHEGDAEAIEFAAHVTPPALLDLSAEGRALGMRAYEDLEASAMSCVAQATYRYLDGETELLRVTLYEEPTDDQPGWTEDYARQSCFNSLLNERIAADQRVLLPADLSAFARTFGSRCTGAETGNRL